MSGVEAPLGPPSRAEWRVFLTRTLAALAVGALLAAAVCFIAFNWQRMGVAFKLGLVQGGMLLSLGLSLWLGQERWQGALAVFAAFFLVGPLLAVYGQAYPSGAPLSTLLFTWAAFVAAGALLCGGQGLWLLALGVFNSACYAWAPLQNGFWGIGRDSTKHLVVGLSDLAAWGLALVLPSWLPSPASRRSLVFAAAFFLNLGFVQEQFLHGQRQALMASALFTAFAAGLAAYAFARRQLFELVLACLCAFSLGNTLLIKGLKDEGFFLLTWLNLFAGGAAVYALNRQHQAWKEGA